MKKNLDRGRYLCPCSFDSLVHRQSRTFVILVLKNTHNQSRSCRIGLADRPPRCKSYQNFMNNGRRDNNRGDRNTTDELFSVSSNQSSSANGSELMNQRIRVRARSRE